MDKSGDRITKKNEVLNIHIDYPRIDPSTHPEDSSFLPTQKKNPDGFTKNRHKCFSLQRGSMGWVGLGEIPLQPSSSSSVSSTRPQKPPPITTGSNGAALRPAHPAPLNQQPDWVARARPEEGRAWWTCRTEEPSPSQAAARGCGNRGVGTTSGSRPSCILRSRSGMVSSNSRDPGFSA